MGKWNLTVLFHYQKDTCQWSAQAQDTCSSSKQNGHEY